MLQGSGGSDISAAVALMTLEMCHRGTLQNDQCGSCEHVMSEFAVSCPQSHNDHLVFSWKEVVCILSVVILRMLLKPSYPLPLFHYGLCSSDLISCRSYSSFSPSFASLSPSSFPGI